MDEKVRTIDSVDEYILKLPEDIQNITTELRKIILDASSTLKEEFKWSMPNYTKSGLVCNLQASKKHVNLGFHKGNELHEKDTNKLLQGTGKTMRHIRIQNIKDIQPEVFTSLIKEAVALNVIKKHHK
ncbi:DUF1801 domain-containing protein [Virgibacillus doumboii]|uniref:DUF1801 domain-containing protein n=1 Tax=Virgibacillus doumboii TaxID=2697503 RepID=UPI0013DF9B79|nr:DUF1801 domain-containing protein [Virgibacillus doumboii]